MSFDNVIYEKGEVATLTLNRPDISNGFNIPTCQEILEVLDLVKADDSVKILVIQAVGKIFSIGGDLAEMQRAVESDNVESLVEIASLVNKISFAMKKLPKPVIMSVDGAVAGAAANMAVAADFVVASEKAKFIQAFVGVGLAPDGGGIFLMSRAMFTLKKQVSLFQVNQEMHAFFHQAMISLKNCVTQKKSLLSQASLELQLMAKSVLSHVVVQIFQVLSLLQVSKQTCMKTLPMLMVSLQLILEWFTNLTQSKN